MPRQLRIEFEGATYHVMARGNRRAKIFLDDSDRERFLKYVEKACGRCGWRVLAWVLMSNHYHLVIHTPQANLVDGMRWLQNAYTRYFNTRHRQWGRLFGDRYKSVLVDESDHDGGIVLNGSRRKVSYITTLVDYVHLNPLRAKLVNVQDGESIRDYRWSSVAQGYALAPSKRSSWLDVRWGLELQDLPDTVAGRRRYIDWLDQRAFEEGPRNAGMVEAEGQTLQSTLRRGWYWGSETFKERMLSLLDKMKGGAARNQVSKNRNYRSSPLAHDHAERQAEQIIQDGVDELGIQLDDEEKPVAIRGDYRRAAVAWAVWRRTSVSQSWIAERLALRSAANVSQQIVRFDAMVSRDLPRQLRVWKRDISRIDD